jgi:hypothetical protein
MLSTTYNNIKSISSWTREYLLSENFKRAVFSIITIGGYHYYFMDKQFMFQKEILDTQIKHEREIRIKEEEIRKRDVELEHIRLINEIKDINKWWFQK